MAYDWGGSDVETDSQIISRLNKEKEALTKANKKLTKQLLIQGVGCSLPTDKEIRLWSQKEASKYEDKKDVALGNAVNLQDGALWMRGKIQK